MKKLFFLCLIFISLNTKAIDSNKLINLNDLINKPYSNLTIILSEQKQNQKEKHGAKS